MGKGYPYENVHGDSFATTDYGSLHDFPVCDPIHRNLYYRSCRSTDILLIVIREIRNHFSLNLLRRKNENTVVARERSVVLYCSEPDSYIPRGLFVYMD